MRSGRLTVAPAPGFAPSDDDRPASRESSPLTIEALLEAHAADVYRIVARLLGPGADRADIDDLGQQVFIALHQALPRFRGDSRVSTWIYGVASRVVYRELRSRKRHRRMVERLEALAEAQPPTSVNLPDLRLELADVWRCLMRVDAKKRIVFILHHIEGLSGPEIARALGIREPTVHSRLFYARRALMRALEASP